MTLPILAAGHKVLSSEWDTILSFSSPLIVRKTSDEVVTSSTAIQDDNHLVLTVLANASYYLQASIIYTAGTVGALKIGWSGPSGATLDCNIGGAAYGSVANATNSYFGWNNISGTDSVGGPGAGQPAMFTSPHGVLITSSTPGSFTFRWAQDTSDAASSTVKAGSVLMLTRIT
jgi:hypothetical protein